MRMPLSTTLPAFLVALLGSSTCLAQTAVYDRMQKVAAGEYQIHYIKHDSTLWAAGHLSPNYLATGEVIRPGMPVVVRQESGAAMPRFKKAYGGLHQNAAIDVAGNVWTLGEPSTYGGCTTCIAGDGGGGNYDYAVRIMTDDLGDPFTGIDMLAMFTGTGSMGWYAVKGADSTLWWWGKDGGMGFSLDGSGASTIQNRPKQVPIPGNKKVVQVIAGGMAVVLCSDGTVYTGAGGCDDYQVPKGYPCTGSNNMVLNQVPGLANVTSIAGGHQIVYAVCGTDSVMAWGRRNLLGIGSNDLNPQTTPMKLELGLPAPVRMIVTNTSSTHAILVDSTLWGWGHSAQGEVGNGTMLDKNIYNFIDGLSGDTIINTPERIVPSRTDFVNIYGAMPYTFFSYFEAANGQLYFCGRNKAGVGGNGETEPPGNNMAANYAQTWSQPKAVPVDIFSLRSRILIPAQQCVDDPNATGCFGYTSPPFLPPTLIASPDQIIATNYTTLSATATTQPGRKLASYIWDQHSGPSYAYFNTFNDSVAYVDRLQTGTYRFTVKATDSLNSWTSDTVTVIVDLSTSMNDPASSGNSITVHPVPASDVLYFTIPATFRGTPVISITAADGRKVRVLPLPHMNGSRGTLNVSGMIPGLYHLTATDELGQRAARSFLVE